MIHTGMHFPEYAALRAENQTLLKEFLKCPAAYRHRLDNPRPDSPAFARGRMWHTAILEPDRLDARYAVFDAETKEQLLADAQAGGSKAKTFSRALSTYKDWEASQTGKELVDELDLLAAKQARDVLWTGEFRDAIDAGMREPSLVNVYEAEAGEVPVKSRFDLWVRHPKFGTVWDLKTTTDASPNGFGRAAWSFGYCFQAGFYKLVAELEGEHVDRFMLVAVETEPPFLHGVYQVEPQAMRHGYEIARAALERLAICRRDDNWPGYGSGTLELPAYAMKEIEEDLQCHPIPDAF